MISSSVKTKKETTAEAVSFAKSKHEAIGILVSSETRNMVKIPGYKAESGNSAKARHYLGESGRGKGEHAGKEIVSKTTGSSYNKKGHKPTGFLTYLDTSSRTENGFDYRTFTVFDSLNPERNIHTLSICDNFGKWCEIPLGHMRDWPELTEQDDFVKKFSQCQKLGELIEIFSKKVDYLKKKVDKSIGLSTNKHRVYYVEPGMTTKIVNASDHSPIPSVRREVKKMKLSSIESVDINELYPQWTCEKGLSSEIEMLPDFMTELESLRVQYAAIYKTVFPYEMGLIESSRNGEGFSETVTVDKTVYEIQINSDYEYDMPDDILEKLETGEYVKTEVKSTRGSWVIENIG